LPLPPVQRARLDACLELARRAAGRQALPPAVSGPGDVYAVTASLREERREHFVGIYLNTRNRILAAETISVGTLNASLVHPREVFAPALRLSAATVVVAHNHPSGETDPSEDDLAITRRLVDAGDLLGISLLDHVIVGRRGYTSLKELGHLLR
jgi:DNA repair protein RadC